MNGNPVDRAAALYESSYGKAPASVASAPGRVNLIGEHVDLYGGHVLPMATAERTAVAVGPGPVAGAFRAVSEQGAAVELAWPVERSGTWADYVAGVARLLIAHVATPPDSLSVAVASDVPLGSGLSSSAAIEVAAAAALSSWWKLPLEPRGLASVAHATETGYVGVPCGMMDQMASALAPEGAALLINCANLETRAVRAGVDVVLVDSGEVHALRKGAYAERRREGEAALAALKKALPGLQYIVDVPLDRLNELVGALPAPLDRRARHVVEENLRAVLGASLLESGDVRTFGRLVNASHDSLRDLYECSTPRLDAIVSAARTTGALGARLVGAGWGGSVLVVAQPGGGADVAAELHRVLRLPPGAVREERAGRGVSVEVGY